MDKKQSMMLKGYFDKIADLSGYNNLPLQKKIIVNYLVLLIIPIIIYYLIFNIYSDNIKDKEVALINQLDRQAVENIDTYIRDLMQLTIQPLYYRRILKDLKRHSQQIEVAGINKPYDYGIRDFSALSESDSELTDMVNRIAVSKKYIHSAFIFDIKGNMLAYNMTNNQLLEAYNPKGEAWFQQCLARNGSPLVVGSSRFKKIAQQVENHSFVFSIARTIKDLDSTRQLGVIGIYAEIAVLRDICSKIRSGNGEKILILDPDNRIIYDENEANIGKTVADHGLEFLRRFIREQNYHYSDAEFKRYLINVFAIQAAHWRLIRIIPENALYLNARLIQNRLFFLITGLTIVSLFLSINIAHRITKPLQKLNQTMQVVEKGDLSIRFNVKYQDEIGQLGQRFNKMLSEIDNLIKDVYLTRMHEKEAELNALQAQINPHFIYNTLESIRMMARLHDDPETANMLSTLGRLLRYSISNKKQLVTVGEELEHLENYMMLQNHRFDDKFELNLNVPEELYPLKIFKLLFQPMVENAIYHGLETLEGKGVITIAGSRTKNGIRFEIRDNGVGMTVEKLAELNGQMEDPNFNSGSSRGVGLHNINERIKLYYGYEYGISIFSSTGKGTVIRLDLPDLEKLSEPEPG